MKKASKHLKIELTLLSLEAICQTLTFFKKIKLTSIAKTMVLESTGTDRVPIFGRPVSGREALSQLVFVLALHFVQHLDGSPPGHGQPVQTHCCSYLQPQRWPTTAPVMSADSDDERPGSLALPAPEESVHVKTRKQSRWLRVGYLPGRQTDDGRGRPPPWLSTQAQETAPVGQYYGC